MREIKFRAWNNILKVMVNEAIDIGKWGVHAPTMQHKDVKRRGDRYDIMQYTGLKDKNGKEIYEGDIVREVFEHDERTDGDRELDFPEDTTWDDNGDMVAINQVVFQNGAFGVTQEDSQFESFDAMRGRTDSWEVYDCEVIGNIYENKELLK